jgi:hypothetical protein
MNYLKIYDTLISKARSRCRKWHYEKESDGTYYERHHIIPRCLGGEGSFWEYKTHSNIVLLTPKEHYIAHLLLHRAYPTNISIQRALWAMVCFKKNSSMSSRFYEQFKQSMRVALTGRKFSDETKKKLSEAKRGKPTGHIMTEEHKEKFGYANKGRSRPDLVERNKLTKGKPGTWVGRKHTQESIEKMKIAHAKKKKLY